MAPDRLENQEIQTKDGDKQSVREQEEMSSGVWRAGLLSLGLFSSFINDSN